MDKGQEYLKKKQKNGHQIQTCVCAASLLNRCKNWLWFTSKNLKLDWAEEPTHYYKCNTRASAPCWLKGCEPSAMLWRLHKEIDDVYHVSIKLQRWLQSQLITGLQIDICMSDKAKLMEELAPSCACVCVCAVHARVCKVGLKLKHLLLSTSIPKVKIGSKWIKVLTWNEEQQH